MTVLYNVHKKAPCHKGRGLVFVFLLAFYSVIICAQTRDFSAPVWLKETPFSYSLKEIVGADGGVIYAFEWHRSDMTSERSTKGVELKTKPMPGLKTQWAFMQFYVDSESFYNDSKTTIIMQYHSVPDYDLGEGWRNPITSLVVRNGGIQYDFRSSKEEVTPGVKGAWQYSSKGSIFLGRPFVGAWNTIVFKQVFGFDNSGSIYIYLNGKEFLREGIGLGFNDRRGAFLKFGIYCPGGSDHENKHIMFRRVGLLDSTGKDEEVMMNILEYLAH